MPPATKGLLIHWAARYDLLVWLVTLGRERAFRERLLEPLALRPGEHVLDVGCGTGSLAIAASRSVGSTGRVQGIDPSPEMIARARHKARRARVDASFEVGVAEALPVPDASVDVTTCTVMLHHLPRAARGSAVREMRRVLKPGGRALVVDFVGAARHGDGLIAHLHRHGHVKPHELGDLVADAGFEVAENGPVGMWNLGFVLGIAR